MSDQQDYGHYNGIDSTSFPFETSEYDEQQNGQSTAGVDPHSINADNASQFVDEEGRGRESGVLIGSGDPVFDAKVEALYQMYGPEMVNAAMEQLTTLSLLEKSKDLVEDMDISDVVKQTMIEQIDRTMQEVTMSPVTDAEGNTLYDDVNGNGRVDENEGPVMLDAGVANDVANVLGEELDANTDTIIEQWRAELTEPDGDVYSGTLGIPQDELDNQDGNPETGESGTDYGDNIIQGEDGNYYYVSDPVHPEDLGMEGSGEASNDDVFTLTDENGDTVVDENGDARQFRLSDEDGSDGASVEDSMFVVEEVQDDMRKDGRGKENGVGNANNGGGGDDEGGTSTEGVDGGDSSTEGMDGDDSSTEGVDGDDSATEGDESVDGGGNDVDPENGFDSSNAPEGGMSSSLSTNNWLVILASALGQTSGKHLKAMLDTGKELGSVDSKENPELFAQLNAEFSAESQIFKMFQEAISTVVKSIGEGMASVARKS